MCLPSVYIAWRSSVVKWTCRLSGVLITAAMTRGYVACCRALSTVAVFMTSCLTFSLLSAQSRSQSLFTLPISDVYILYMYCTFCSMYIKCEHYCSMVNFLYCLFMCFFAVKMSVLVFVTLKCRRSSRS